MRKWTRRAFIGLGTLVGGGFVLGVAGVALSPSRHSVLGDDAADAEQLTTWILITPDNIVTVLVPHCEMGQGSQTALAMMAAEEMNADWNLVRVKEAPALDAYANAYMGRAFTGDSIPRPLGRAFDYGTYRLARWYGLQPTGGLVGGSWHGSLRDDRGRCRGAGRCSSPPPPRRFGVPAAECKAVNSRVVHEGIREERDVRRAGRRRREALGARPRPALKDPATLHHPPHGAAALRHPHRRSTAARCTASISARQACCRRPSKWRRWPAASSCRSTAAPAEAMPGVKRVVRLENAVAVVADTYWRARTGHRRARPQVRRCRPRRCVDGVDFRGLRHRARRAAGVARRGAPNSSRPTTVCRSWPTRPWSRWCARCASKAIAPTCGPASRIRSTHGPPRRRRSVSTPNRCV